MHLPPLSVSCTALLLSAASASAVDIQVFPDGSGDAPTIAAAFGVATAGDRIVLGPGTYYEHDIPMTTRVDLVSATGDRTSTILDAQGRGRCLVGPAIEGPASVSSLTLQNGRHDVEGGLVVSSRG
ncbi:MAG TPA: hypothetical protein VKU85_12805, partial [bacterium]|nr:hypothetical protein [bacterium]